MAISPIYSNFSFLVQVCQSAHNGYVATYKCLELIGEQVDKCTHRPVQKLRRYVHYPIAQACSTAVHKVCQWKNAIFGRGKSKQNMLVKSARGPSVKKLSNDLRFSLMRLSSLCSKIFKRPVFIAQFKNKEQIDILIHKLNQVIKVHQKDLISNVTAKAHEALEHCFHILQLIQDLEEERGRPLTGEDFDELYASLKGNIIYSYSEASLLENVGEFLGGKVASDWDGYNPAYMAMRAAQVYIGEPVGHVLGLTGSCLAAHFVLKKIPLFSLEHGRTLLLWGTVATFVFLDHFDLNPASQYCQKIFGQYVGDLGFYSVGLLFNYVGMTLFGTEERLSDYVEKMTPAMISYYVGKALLEHCGVPSTINEPLSYFISHIAYNFDSYKSFAQGTILEDRLKTDPYQDTVSQLQIRSITQEVTSSARQRLTKMVLRSLYKYIHYPQHMQETQKFFFQSVAKKVSKAISLPSKFDELRALSEDEAFLLRKHIPYSELSLLSREFNDFFAFLQQPLSQRILKEIHSQITRSIKNPRIAALPLNPQNQSNPLEVMVDTLSRAMVRQLGHDFLPEECSAILKGDPLNEFSFNLEQSIDGALPKGLLPSLSEEERLQSTYFIGILSSLFTVWTMLIFIETNHNPLERMKSLSKNELKEFYKNIGRFVLQMRHPFELRSLPRWVHRKVAQILLNYQLA